MTELILPSTVKECDELCDGIRQFIFRGTDCKFRLGYILKLQPYMDGRPRMHRILGHRYQVTYLSTDHPLLDGSQVIGLREVTKW